MSEKKKPKDWHATGTHPTNTSRARVSDSKTSPEGGSYAAASAARNERAGNGKRSTFNQPKMSKFIPHDVRAAGFRRDGFTPEEAKRMAEDDDNNYLASSWADSKALKGSLLGIKDIKWR